LLVKPLVLRPTVRTIAAGTALKQIKTSLGAVQPTQIMNDKEDSNYISVGSWMGTLFITAIPVVGLLMMLVWAFTGENESRKNYFRAILSWIVILVVLCVGAAFVVGYMGEGPALQKFIQEHQR
jgi:uncharacterized membrane protein YidH (DUF202 family)